MKHRWKNLNRKGKEKAEKIRKQGARLFAEQGYLETTMDQVAAASRLSKGGMYYYFRSKPELLFFILLNFMEQLLEHLEEDLTHITRAEDKLHFIVFRHIELYGKDPHVCKTLLHEAHCLPSKYFRVIADKERRYYQILSSVISEVLENKVSNPRMKALTFILFGACNWIYWWYNPKGEIMPAELARIICGTFVNGVKGQEMGE